MIHIFTSSAPNYFGKVRLLAQSLRRAFPTARIHWLVADQRGEDPVGLLEPAIDEMHFVDDVAFSHERSWLFQHDLVELSTAIKPDAALALLGREDCELVLYFDPDIVVFSPLDDLVAQLRQASVVLTPHLLQPEKELDAVLDHELCALRHGVFNLGFFGVRDCSEGVAFLEWWRERCRSHCLGDWRTGTFTDQKWINFAPVFFPNTAILRSPRFNVAPWNINQRELSGTFDEGFRIAAEPLGFYHFTGFDSGAHNQVLQKYAAGNESVTMLVEWYAGRARALTPARDLAWRLGSYGNGASISPLARDVYRSRTDLQAAFPDPYHVTNDQPSFWSWMRWTAPLEYPGRATETSKGEWSEP